MPSYRRAFIPGGTRFFAVNLLKRRINILLVRNISVLRGVVNCVRQRYQFQVDAGW